MKRIALYPGTFDPVTIGHQSMVKRALPLFDQIIVAIGINSSKNSYFSIEKRTQWLNTVFAPYPQVIIDSFQGLTIDYCMKMNARFILRGLRSSTDFEYERNIAQANSSLAPDIETIFLVSSPGLSAISSSIVRDIHQNGGDVSKFIPSGIMLDSY
ncbi:MAG: pantetheine-phosphate adenylyltransferase [Candidatus Competibacteraceae bacterium]|nr:pantetheine-phosphate adenylyltransferase [Candidatus Competibacteraceae bacterium]